MVMVRVRVKRGLSCTKNNFEKMAIYLYLVLDRGVAFIHTAPELCSPLPVSITQLRAFGFPAVVYNT